MVSRRKLELTVFPGLDFIYQIASSSKWLLIAALAVDELGRTSKIRKRRSRASSCDVLKRDLTTLRILPSLSLSLNFW